MIAIKGLEMPEDCSRCERYFRECKLSYDFDNYLITRPSGCPLVEIGTCKDCERYNRNEMFCTWNGGYLMQKCDPDYYCADFKKRGNEDGSN